MKRINKLRDESEAVRKLLYADEYYCKKMTREEYDNYLLDSPKVVNKIDEVLSGNGIKLLVSSTGSGKSSAICNRAKALVNKDKSTKVFILSPSRVLTEQIASEYKIDKLVGGDVLKTDSTVVICTYEKFFEIEEYLLHNKKPDEKIVLVLDEVHNFATQNKFREEAIQKIIDTIEQKLVDNVVLVTATPEPVSLFRCEEIVYFESRMKKSPFKKIDIIVVDDVIEYIKNLDYDKEFPFIRLNSKANIEEIVSSVSQRMVQITSDDKNSAAYKDIVQNGKIDNLHADGMICTSILEAGTSIKDYPDNIVPMACYCDANICVDDIEQFLNRIRYNGKQIESARVVLQKPKGRQIKASILKPDGTVICTFTDVELQEDKLIINDTMKLSLLAEGTYKIKSEIGKSIQYFFLNISATGKTYKTRYSKADPQKPIEISEFGFQEFLTILQENLKRAQELQEEYVELKEISRIRRENKCKSGKYTLDEIKKMEYKDEENLASYIKSELSRMKEIGECLYMENGELKIKKRFLYMFSYFRFNRQYYREHNLLKETLEERLKVPVEIKEEDNTKVSHKVINQDKIWDGIEDYRVFIRKNSRKAYLETLFPDSAGSPFINKEDRKVLNEIKGEKHIIELMVNLRKAGVESIEIIAKAITSSTSVKKVNEYKKVYGVILRNKMLDSMYCQGTEAKDLLNFNKDQENKLQSAIFCYLKKMNTQLPTLNDKLADEIISYYKQQFPLAKGVTRLKVKRAIHKMYKFKGNDRFFPDMPYLKETDIFTIVEADQ